MAFGWGVQMSNPESFGPPIRSEFAGDPDMLELVEEFVRELPGRAASLSASYDQGEIESVTRLTHQLSGACGGYGFGEIGEVARDLECRLKKMGSAAELLTVREQVDELVSMCSRVVV